MDSPEMSSPAIDHITSVPLEVIEIILSYSDITIKDTINFLSTCQYFRTNVYPMQSIWKNSLFTTWPLLENAYRSYISCISDWCGQCKHIRETENFCRETVRGMSSRYYWRLITISNTDLSDFYIKSTENSGLAIHYMINCLRNICNSDVEYSDDSTGPPFVTLTHQYYAGIILENLLHTQMKHDWNRLMENTVDAVPDTVALFFIQWILPKSELQDKEVSEYLSSVVKKVQALLPREHPLLRTDKSIQKQWERVYQEDNMWCPSDCRIIIQTIAHVFAQVEGFCASQFPGAKYFDIGQTIKSKIGHKLILTILFEAIARRCGLRCDIVCSEHHLFVHWRQSWSENNYNLLEIMTGVLRPSQGRCHFRPDSVPQIGVKKYSPLSVLTYLADDIYNVFNLYDLRTGNNALNLLHFLYPKNCSYLCFIAKNYIHQNKEHTEIKERLTQLLYESNLPEDRENIAEILEEFFEIERKYNGHSHKMLVVKVRPLHLVFAVGMVCSHKVHQYKCVIRGWDAVCEASQDWQRNMGVSHLKYGASQPFYKVVAEDNSDRYVAQENLTFDFGAYRIKAVEETISREFSHFNGYFYVPNTEKRSEYPDDEVYTSFFVSRMKAEQY